MNRRIDEMDERFDLGLQDAPRSTTYRYLEGSKSLKCTVRWNGKNLKRDGINSHPEAYSSDPIADRVKG